MDILSGLAGGVGYIIRNPVTQSTRAAGDGTCDRVLLGVSYNLGAGDQIGVMTTTSSGGTTAVNLTGNALAQTFTGNAGANQLNGRAAPTR